MSPHRPWRRRHAIPNYTDPAVLFAELQRRELRDLERCRIVWEGGGDPLAVLAAVTQAGLPEWLTDALLVLLVDGADEGTFQRRLWRRRTRAARDATRAAGVAEARAHPNIPQTWEWSYLLADVFVRERIRDEPAVSPSAMKRSYQRVCRGLSDPVSYYRLPGIGARIQEARKRVTEVMRRSLSGRGPK